MSRRFSADNSEIRWTIPAATDFTGAFTLAIIWRRRHATVNTWDALFGHHNSSNVPRLSIEKANTDKIELGIDDTTFVDSTTTITSTTNWNIIAVSKAAGSATARFHFKDLTAATAWVHENASGAAGNPSTASSGTIRVGEYNDVDDMDGNVAVIAGWNLALSDAQCAELSVNNRTSDFWNNSGGRPKYLYELNQPVSTDAVPDLAGNGATWSVTSSTTVDGATDPPSWTYDGLGVAPGVIRTFSPIPFIGGVHG